MKGSEEVYCYIGVKALQKLHMCIVLANDAICLLNVCRNGCSGEPCRRPSAKQLPKESGQLHCCMAFMHRTVTIKALI